MYVVFSTACLDYGASSRVNHLTYVRMDPFHIGITYEGASGLDMKHQVNIELA